MTQHRAVDSMESIYERPGFLLRRAHQLSVSLFERHCSAYGLTPLQYGVLSTVAHAEGIDQMTLSKALGHDKVTISHVVRNLEARELLTRAASVGGRRRMLIRLTRQGQAVLRQAVEGAALAYERLLSPLADADQAQLLRLLSQLCAGLEDDARAPMVKLPVEKGQG